MKEHYRDAQAQLWCGDALTTLQMLAVTDEAQCCVTSPPYFGLRDYGMAGQIGLEHTPDEYVARLVEVFRAVRDVLRDNGTLWLNMGDSYGAKQLLGIPWRVAFSLQADGWYLRQDIIWAKSNPMPESVTDRCTKAHEYVFLFSKKPRYYFDAEAVKEPCAEVSVARRGRADLRQKEGWAEAYRGNPPRGLARSKRDSFKREGSKREQAIPGQTEGTHREDREESAYSLETRNRRSVWTVATRPFKGAHFAVFPPALIEPCILAGCPAGGAVLDPFAGSGTTGVVAKQHARKFIGVELNPSYCGMAVERIKRSFQQCD